MIAQSGRERRGCLNEVDVGVNVRREEEQVVEDECTTRRREDEQDEGVENSNKINTKWKWEQATPREEKFTHRCR